MSDFCQPRRPPPRHLPQQERPAGHPRRASTCKRKALAAPAGLAAAGHAARRRAPARYSTSVKSLPVCSCERIIATSAIAAMTTMYQAGAKLLPVSWMSHMEM